MEGEEEAVRNKNYFYQNFSSIYFNHNVAEYLYYKHFMILKLIYLVSQFIYPQSHHDKLHHYPD